MLAEAVPPPRIGGRNWEDSERQNSGEEGKQQGVSRAAVLLTLKESRIRAGAPGA